MGNEVDIQRKEFLIQMYTQLWNNMNRHILIIWHSIAVLVSSFVLFSFIGNGTIDIDIGVSLIVALIIWHCLTIIDSSHWYNRNLSIIINIERQFLSEGDLREIHYFFGGRPKKNKIITHFKIQGAFGMFIGVVVIIYHIFNRVQPAVNVGDFRIENLMWITPYIMIVLGIILIQLFNRDSDNRMSQLITNSPGKEINAEEISFNEGHLTKE